MANPIFSQLQRAKFLTSAPCVQLKIWVKTRSLQGAHREDVLGRALFSRLMGENHPSGYPLRLCFLNFRTKPRAKRSLKVPKGWSVVR
jgi:hypothetical protein